MGGAPGIISSQGGDDGWAEKTKGGTGVLGEEKWHKMLWGEVWAEVIADVEDIYQALVCGHGSTLLLAHAQGSPSQTE